MQITPIWEIVEKKGNGESAEKRGRAARSADRQCRDKASAAFARRTMALSTTVVMSRNDSGAVDNDPSYDPLMASSAFAPPQQMFDTV